MSGRPAQGFDYSRRGDSVVISYRGSKAAVLRGEAAQRFLADVESGDPQLVMAKATGNFMRGNERRAADHPRNRR
jgi:hypothetical protein